MPVVQDKLPSIDGLPLAMEIHGPADGPCLVFSHGFGQTRGSWWATAGRLAMHGWRSTLFDARGHGDSGRQADGDYVLDDLVADLAAVVRTQPSPPVLVGASMGGLVNMVALGEQALPPCRALVLVDITPRWETAGVDRILGFMRAFPHGFASLDDAASAVAAYLPQRARRKSEGQLKALLRQSADGRWRWHWDPAMLDSVAERHADYQPRLMAAAGRIKLPTLLLSGGRSDVVSSETVEEFRRLVPHATHVELPRATHTLAGDDNDAFAREVERFLDSLPAAAGQASAMNHR